LGDATIIDLLAETGDLFAYEHPRQLVKLAGLTLQESSSGLHKGQKRISKRGRRRLRALLFRVMLPMVRHNQAFKALHRYYTTRTKNPLRKKQSIVVLCGKLLKILHTLATKHRTFSEAQLLKDLPMFQEAPTA
uniref:transposase n=1 Tax=Shouchella shacheensis TaxID=1649580 RepID=UPI000A5218ED